jgi:hypothetical protein
VKELYITYNTPLREIVKALKAAKEDSLGIRVVHKLSGPYAGLELVLILQPEGPDDSELN